MADDVDYGAGDAPGIGAPEGQAHAVTAHAVTAHSATPPTDGWVRASVKVPGGKLVTAAVRLTADGQRIAKVRFSGDFFVDALAAEIAAAGVGDAAGDGAAKGAGVVDADGGDAIMLETMGRAVVGTSVDASVEALARTIGHANGGPWPIEGAMPADFAAAVIKAMGGKPPRFFGSALTRFAQDDAGSGKDTHSGVAHPNRDGKGNGDDGSGEDTQSAPAMRSALDGNVDRGPLRFSAPQPVPAWPDDAWRNLPLGVIVPAVIGGASTTSSGAYAESNGTPTTSGAYGPAMQMALDEVLAREVAAGRLGPTLRFWEWSEPAVVIGAYQSLHDEVDLAAAQERGMTVVRRITGGGAMFIEPGNTITYSLYVPESFVGGLSVAQSYRLCDAWLFEALAQLGIDAYPGGMNDVISPAGKIAGAAQRRFVSPSPLSCGLRASGAILHHVTMAYDIDAQAMVRVLRINRAKTADKAVKSAVKRVDPLRSQTGLTREAIIKSFARTLLDGLPYARPATLPPGIVEQARALAARRYESDAWTARIA